MCGFQLENTFFRSWVFGLLFADSSQFGLPFHNEKTHFETKFANRANLLANQCIGSFAYRLIVRYLKDSVPSRVVDSCNQGSVAKRFTLVYNAHPQI